MSANFGIDSKRKNTSLFASVLKDFSGRSTIPFCALQIGKEKPSTKIIPKNSICCCGTVGSAQPW